MKKIFAIVAIFAMCAAVFANGAQEAQPAAAAAAAPAAPAQAQSVNAYTTLEEPLAAALFEQFEKETGIHVNFVRLAGGECITRLEAEKDNPQVSIWVGGVGLDHITAKSKGLSTPYVSRYASKTPAQYQDPDHYWIGLYLGPLTFATNIDRAKELGLEIPTSWADLIKPEYKGYVRMANPNSSGTAYEVLSTMTFLFDGDEDKMMEYMAALDKNIDQYTKSGSAPGKSVATGEIPIAIGHAHDQVKLKAEGANIAITAPSEGTGYEIGSMSMIKGGKDEVNAKKLYDWIISDADAQEIFTQWYVILVQDGAKKHPLAIDFSSLKTVNMDFEWAGDAVNKTRQLNRWNEEIGNKR